MLLCLAAPLPAGAQRAASALDRRFWLGAGALFVGSLALDRQIQEVVADNRAPALTRVGEAGNVLGSGRYLLAGMAAAYSAGRLTRHREWSHSVARAALAYAAGNLVASALKPAVGRHRPIGAAGPGEAHPFSSGGDWHSFPSAHAIHAFTLAASISEQAHRTWVTRTVYTAATVVGWSRVYRKQHWASDVVAGAVLGIASSSVTGRWANR